MSALANSPAVQTLPNGWQLQAASATGSQSARFWGRAYVALAVVAWTLGLVLGFEVGLTVLVVAGFASAIAGLHIRALGLIGVATLCTIDAVTRVYLMTGGLLRWNTFNYFLLIVMIIALPTWIRRRDPHTRLMQAFLAVLLVWFIISPDWLRGAQHTLNALTMFGLLVYFVRASDDENAWYWMAVACGAVAGLGGMVFFLQRSELTYIDRNALSHFPMTAMFTAAMGFRFARRIPFGQLTLALLSATNFAWAFLTTSRGGTLIACCCLLYILSEMRGVGRRLVIVSAAAVVTLTVMNQFPEYRERTIERVYRLFDSSYSITKRTSGRADLALAGWYMFQSKPIGVGTGGFARHWAEYSLTHRDVGMKKGHGVEYAAHNAWMKILAENGVPGFLLFAAFIFSFAIVGLFSPESGHFRLGLLATVCLTVAFQVTEFQAKGLWLLASGVTVLLHRRPTDNIWLEDLDSGLYEAPVAARD